MDFKVAGKCFIEQGSGLVIDTAGNRLPTKSVLFCRMAPFIITEDGDVDNFAGEKVDAIYQATDEYIDFFKEQARELQAEKSHSIITSVFLAITGTRHKNRRRQVMGISPTPVMMGMTNPIIVADTLAPSTSEGPTHYNNADRGRSTCHHSTPNMSPVPQHYHQHRQHDRQRQQRYNHYDWRFQHCSRQEPDHRRYSHTLPNTDNNSTSVVLHALEKFSAKQALAQSTCNSIQEFDGSNREATVPWLDQVELVAERMGIDPLEVGISNLKGLA